MSKRKSFVRQYYDYLEIKEGMQEKIVTNEKTIV